LGSLQVFRNIGILSRKGERMPSFRGCAKGTALIIKRYGTEVQLDRVRQFRDDKQQTPGHALRGWSNRVTVHRRTASDLPRSPVNQPLVE
jgi:hypothetical protein